MSTENPGFESHNPKQLLATTAAYARRARSAQRETWFPLLILGLVVVSHALFPLDGPGNCGPLVVGSRGAFRPCTIAGTGSFFWHWTISLSLAYVVITGFYLWQARHRGVGTRVGRYFWAWLGGLVLIGGSVWAVHNRLDSLAAHGVLGLTLPGFTPLLAIGVGLFVLAWVERNPALAWFAVGYLILAGVLVLTTWASDRLVQLAGPTHPSAVGALRFLTIGGVLLLGSAGFAIRERSQS
jgi:hypothetical protein